MHSKPSRIKHLCRRQRVSALQKIWKSRSPICTQTKSQTRSNNSISPATTTDLYQRAPQSSKYWHFLPRKHQSSSTTRPKVARKLGLIPSASRLCRIRTRRRVPSHSHRHLILSNRRPPWRRQPLMAAISRTTSTLQIKNWGSSGRILTAKRATQTTAISRKALFAMACSTMSSTRTARPRKRVTLARSKTSIFTRSLRTMKMSRSCDLTKIRLPRARTKW